MTDIFIIIHQSSALFERAKEETIARYQCGLTFLFSFLFSHFRLHSRWIHPSSIISYHPRSFRALTVLLIRIFMPFMQTRYIHPVATHLITTTIRKKKTSKTPSHLIQSFSSANQLSLFMIRPDAMHVPLPRLDWCQCALNWLVGCARTHARLCVLCVLFLWCRSKKEHEVFFFSPSLIKRQNPLIYRCVVSLCSPSMIKMNEDM